MRQHLELSLAINPELLAARELFSLLKLPSAAKVETFSVRNFQIIELRLKSNSLLDGMRLSQMRNVYKGNYLICAVQRGNEVVIPSGNFIIEEGDRIHFTSDARVLRDFLAEIKTVKLPLRNIMIVGGSKIGYYLAEELSKKKYKIKLIEDDRSNAEELAESLPHVTVINGNGTQHDLLVEEGIEAMDALVALTNIDEENMIVSMFANKMKVRKTITQIKNDDLYGMLGELGINNTVSPKEIVADRIISYIRALENTIGSNVLTLYRLVNNRVEALEFLAKRKENIYNKPLRELKIKQNCLIACIIRGTRVIIPDGNATICLGDNVVVVTTHKNFDDLTDIFE
jgi:trk system potassium uptake protein TrkA